MPLFDGTGPRGMGPRTGRGRGKCGGLTSNLVGKTLTKIIIPAVGVVVNDIRKPDGITRRLYTSVKSRIAKKELKNPDVHLIRENNDSDKKSE